MLCQFTVRNFKSIQDEITFDMQAVAISEHVDQVICDVDGERFLPVSVIYGPNGGGKSNVLEALYTLSSKVLRPIYLLHNKDDYEYKAGIVLVEPFAFSEAGRNSPTEFEIFFRTSNAEYRYILHVKIETIIYESLDRIKLNAKRRIPTNLFRRTADGIELNRSFKEVKIGGEFADTLPLLSYLGISYSKNETIRDVLGWFEDSICYLNYGDPIRELLSVVARSENAKKLVLDMIREMDLDIEDFRVEEDGNNRIRVFTKHIVGDYSAEISLLKESSGTQKIFNLLPFIVKSLKNGTTLVIDELDAKVHPVLLGYIIRLYTNLDINRNHGQLIFTSHDLSTMNNEIFRRDEIWFVAKGSEQNSEMYSLVEFKVKRGDAVRKDAKYDKQYLEGKYGADPYLKKIINWGDADV